MYNHNVCKLSSVPCGSHVDTLVVLPFSSNLSMYPYTCINWTYIRCRRLAGRHSVAVPFCSNLSSYQSINPSICLWCIHLSISLSIYPWACMHWMYICGHLCCGLSLSICISIYLYMRLPMYTSIYLSVAYIYICYACIYLCICLCIYICIYIYICIRIHVVCIYICMYINMLWVHIYVHIWIYTHMNIYKRRMRSIYE